MNPQVITAVPVDELCQVCVCVCGVMNSTQLLTVGSRHLSGRQTELAD
jgi:hypothetical protein